MKMGEGYERTKGIKGQEKSCFFFRDFRFPSRYQWDLRAFGIL